MLLNTKIIKEVKGVSFGNALRRFMYVNPDSQQVKIRTDYVKDLLNRSYDELPRPLERVFRLMKQDGIGFDYEQFYADMEVWDDIDNTVKRDIAKTVFQTVHGGNREGAGRKPNDGKPKVAFPVSRVADDVASIVRMHEGYDSMTEFTEVAIRYFNKHNPNGTLS